MSIKSVVCANLGKISSFGKKILGRGGNRYKSIAQKFLAVGVSFSLAAAMVPLGKSRFVAEAADEPATEIEIPLQVFATKEQLIELTNTTNGGGGLLASDTASNNVELVFEFEDLAGTPGDYRLIGSDSARTCFISTDPVQTNMWFLSFSTMKNDNYCRIPAFGRHEALEWVALPYRYEYSGYLENVDSMVTLLSNEAKLFDWSVSKTYVSGLSIDFSDGAAWVRPSLSGDENDDSGHPCVGFPSKSFAFASSVRRDGRVGDALVTRAVPLEGSGLSAEGLVAVDGSVVSATAPLDCTWVVMVCSADGEPYVKVVELTEGSSASFDAAELMGVGFTGCLISWLEEPVSVASGGYTGPDGTWVQAGSVDMDLQVAFASAPIVVSFTDGSSDSGAGMGDAQGEGNYAPDIGDDDTGASNPTVTPDASPSEDATLDSKLSTTVNGLNIFVEDPNSALPDGVYLDVQLIEPGTKRWNELSGNYDGTHEVENVSFFEITLRYIKDDSPVEMPLSSPIRVLMQIPEGWDKSDMEAVLIASGADRQFEENIVTKDGIDYVAFWSDHFSPYALIDKLSAAEKSANQTSPQTGDEVTYLTISVLGLIMTLALGLMFKTYFGKRKFND